MLIFFKNSLKFLIAVVLAVLVFLQSSGSALAQVSPQSWEGNCIETGPGGTPVATIQGLNCLVANVLVSAISLLGIASLVMFIYAGFRWMLSGDDTKGTQAARNTMTYAVIGIVVALSAYIVLNLLSDFVEIPTLLRFNIPGSNTGFEQERVIINGRE